MLLLILTCNDYTREKIAADPRLLSHHPNGHIPPYTLFSNTKEREESYSMPNIGPKRRIYDFRYPASDISTEEPSDNFTDEESLPSNTSVEGNMSIEDETILENVLSPTSTIYSYTTTSDESDEDERLNTLRNIQDNINTPSLDTSIEIERIERSSPKTPANDSATTVYRMKTLASPRVLKL